jgi:outer membrane protein OmpA-like peptidoglycan-associated protein
MSSARRFPICPVLVALLTASCGPQRVAGPVRPGDELTVLLVDAETGAVGRATVSNSGGSVTLDSAREGTSLAQGQAPGRPGTLSDGDVKRLFGDALSALPPAVRHFTLNFRFESDELTAESSALVPEVLKAVKDRPVPDVVVVGHTDTMGTPEANIELGLKRAAMVRNLLVEAGLSTSAIEVTSHGEADLLIKTPNDTAEPRNRRVEIAVR